MGTNPTRIGYRFTGGGSGIVFQDNAAGSLDKGIVFNGAIQRNASSKRIRGLILASDFVHRFDSESNISVIATNTSEKLRVTIAGSDHTGFTAAGFLGQMRHP